jgi:hypothetical protein
LLSFLTGINSFSPFYHRRTGASPCDFGLPPAPGVRFLKLAPMFTRIHSPQYSHGYRSDDYILTVLVSNLSTSLYLNYFFIDSQMAKNFIFFLFIIEGNITAGRNRMFGRIQGPPLALYYFTKGSRIEKPRALVTPTSANGQGLHACMHQRTRGFQKVAPPIQIQIQKAFKRQL